jgi:hypothetical protein
VVLDVAVDCAPELLAFLGVRRRLRVDEDELVIERDCGARNVALPAVVLRVLGPPVGVRRRPAPEVGSDLRDLDRRSLVGRG